MEAFRGRAVVENVFLRTPAIGEEYKLGRVSPELLI
jgi:hypothetical protein